mgnify:CR=1 FL=1
MRDKSGIASQHVVDANGFPLHGGANEAVMHLLKEVGSAKNAEKWMLDALAQKKNIMGFGHRVYKRGDSRVPTMTDAFKKMVADFTDNERSAMFSGTASRVYAL